MGIVERLRTEQPSYVLNVKAAIEIERLREQCEFEKKCRNDAFEELKQRDADIERLREALQFYASKNNYKTKKVWTTTLMTKNIAFPQYEPDGYKIVSQYHTPVLSDNGERARAALPEKKQRLWNPWTNSKDMKAPEKMIDVMLANGEIIPKFSGRELNWLDNMDPDKKIVSWRDVE